MLLKMYLYHRKKTELLEGDRNRGLINSIFRNFLKKNSISFYSIITSLGAVFAERFNRTIRDVLEKVVFQKGDANWIDLLPTITKQYKNRLKSSTKLTPIQASLNYDAGFVYEKFLDKRTKKNQKII